MKEYTKHEILDLIEDLKASRLAIGCSHPLQHFVADNKKEEWEGYLKFHGESLISKAVFDKLKPSIVHSDIICGGNSKLDIAILPIELYKDLITCLHAASEFQDTIDTLENIVYDLQQSLEID